MGPFPAGGLWGPFPGGGFYELLCLDHACSALDWADEFLFGGVDSPRFVQAAERATVSGATPFFYPKAWGSVEAWRGEGDADARAYAVLEGIGFALLHLGGETFFGTGDEVVALGGGSRLDAWLRLVADIFGCSLVRGQRDGLDGAARIAGVPVPDAGHAGGGEVFAPGNRDREMLQERYQRWISGLGS